VRSGKGEFAMAAQRRRRKGKSSRRGLFFKRSTLDEQVPQREVAFAAIKRLHAESLPLWRVCSRGACRRHKECQGDAVSCLKRGWPLMPPDLQQRAYEEVVRGGPRLPPATHREWLLRG